MASGRRKVWRHIFDPIWTSSGSLVALITAQVKIPPPGCSASPLLAKLRVSRIPGNTPKHDTNVVRFRTIFETKS